MSAPTLVPIVELGRFDSPAVTPQALAWHHGALWMGSRDLRRVYAIDVETWEVRNDFPTPGIPWAAVSVGEVVWFTLGVGKDDDRYIYRYVPAVGFKTREPIACPELTGSYLSHDGQHLHLSQWYKKRILRLSDKGEVLRAFDVGLEISGHTWIKGLFYVLRGTEAGDESWRISRFDPSMPNPDLVDVAAVPFQCRSLTFDGKRFWSSHRSANQIVAFALPA